MINIFLMDMSSAQNTSGVDRYIHTLVAGLQGRTDLNVYWIQLVHDDKRLLHRAEQFPHYVKFTIAMPQQSNEIIGQRFWMRKYNEHVYKLTRHLFENKTNCIIHLHTLNLIDLALYVKEQTGCKIITHLHCIPWKGMYNGNMKKFNELYADYYLQGKRPKAIEDEFTTNNCEVESYNSADHVVCVTRCAREFLQHRMTRYNGMVTMVPNGINSSCDRVVLRKHKTPTDTFRLIYAGVVSESKGLKYILKALSIVQEKGYKVSLDIAGMFPPMLDIRYKSEYPELQLNFRGRIPFDELKTLYAESDMGVIASLQEQASYVAIEMAMFGLPIVTTAVDGLDEMFTDGVNALKVNTRFSKVFGLSVDEEMMAEKIINLIENQELRKELGANARHLYETELTLDLMIDRTVEVYKRVLNTIPDKTSPLTPLLEERGK